MNRLSISDELGRVDVPRRRGDEPIDKSDLKRTHLCSPQARG